MARAKKIQEGVLGLKPAQKFRKTLSSTTLARARSSWPAPQQWKPSPKGTSAALEVKDVSATVAHLKKKKINPAVGSGGRPPCWMLEIRDPDGNLICLHHRKTALEMRRTKEVTIK